MVKRQIKVFKFEWSRFDAGMGLIFMTGVLLVSALNGTFDFSMSAAGISALLAWLPIILAPQQTRRQHLQGLLAYLLVGAALTWLADAVTPYQGGKLISTTLITFAGFMMLLRGMHPFVVAWCLVYWYLLAPLFIGDPEGGSVMIGHLVGCTLVIVLNLLKPVWARATGKARAEALSAEEPGGQTPQTERPSLGFVTSFATTVSLAMFVGVAAGMRWLTTDPTLIANATLNMISPSLQQTWQAAVERIVLGSLGLLGGFYFGWYFPEPWVGYGVTAVCSFLALGALYINFALVVAILFFVSAYSWGTMQSDLAHLIGNEKLIGEFIGVAIAVIAISILTRLQRGKEDTS